MPYIESKERPEIDEAILQAATHISTPGQLNYAISQLVWLYVSMKGLRYTNFNEAIGVLECAKLELYRKPIAEYENLKCNENGDVYVK